MNTPTAVVAATRAGLRVHLLQPDPVMILPADISEGLAKLNRWNGATRVPFSVAQHSVYVAALMFRTAPTAKARAALYGILHDGHEYLIGDIAEPTRLALDQLAGHRVTAALTVLREKLDVAIHQSFGLDWPMSRPMAKLLKQCHARIVATEVRDLFSGNFTPADIAVPEHAFADPLAERIAPYTSWVHAEAAFKDALLRYHHSATVLED